MKNLALRLDDDLARRFERWTVEHFGVRGKQQAGILALRRLVDAPEPADDPAAPRTPTERAAVAALLVVLRSDSKMRGVIADLLKIADEGLEPATMQEQWESPLEVHEGGREREPVVYTHENPGVIHERKREGPTTRPKKKASNHDETPPEKHS